MTVLPQTFKGEPFIDSPDPHLAFRHEIFERVAAEIVFSRLSDRQGLTLIEGPVNAGKTTLLACLAADPRHSGSVLAISGNRNLTGARLIEFCCHGFGLAEREMPKRDDLESWMDAFGIAATNRSRRDGSMLLLIDCAEALSKETLEVLVRLSEMRLGGRKLLHTVLALDCADDDDPLPAAYLGQEQAVAFRYWLGPIKAEEIQPFTAFRLEQAGYKEISIFAEGALEEVFRISGGLIGRVNTLCREAIVQANVLSEEIISAATVGQAARNLGMEPVVAARSRTENGREEPLPLPSPANDPMPKLGTQDWDLSLDDLVPGFDASEISVSSPEASFAEPLRPNPAIPYRRIFSEEEHKGGMKEEPGTRDANQSFIQRILPQSVLPWVSFGSVMVAAVMVVAAYLSTQDLEPTGVASVELEVPAEGSVVLPKLLENPERRQQTASEEGGQSKTGTAADPGQGQDVTTSGGETEAKNTGPDTATASQAKPPSMSEELLEVLSRLGYSAHAGTGAPISVNAVKDYQRDHGLRRDGRVSETLVNHAKSFLGMKEAVVKYHMKDFQGAIESYEEVLALQPNDRDSRMFKGLARIKIGELEGGVEDIRLAGKLQPKGDLALFIPARVYYIQERLRRLGFDPGRNDGLFDEGTEQAIRQYQRLQGLALDATPSFDLLTHLEAYTYHAQAIESYREGKNAEAIKYYDLTIALSPDNAEAYFNRGLAKKKMGRL
ncbi:MAG: peptidoglycan-binding protein, partial [Kiloniellales bacterium]|nr:peptidoglycan-binding protein [Kiloniellales bacterium]